MARPKEGGGGYEEKEPKEGKEKQFSEEETKLRKETTQRRKGRKKEGEKFGLQSVCAVKYRLVLSSMTISVESQGGNNGQRPGHDLSYRSEKG